MLVYTAFPNLTRDDQCDLIRHLEILCARTKNLSLKLQFIRDVCIPALKEYGGNVTNGLDFLDLAQNSGLNPTELGRSVAEYYQTMKKWVNTSEAAKYMECSVSKIQRLAKKGIPHLEVRLNKHKHYEINTVSINDLMIRTKQVQIN